MHSTRSVPRSLRFPSFPLLTASILQGVFLPSLFIAHIPLETDHSTDHHVSSSLCCPLHIISVCPVALSQYPVSSGAFSGTSLTDPHMNTPILFTRADTLPLLRCLSFSLNPFLSCPSQTHTHTISMDFSLQSPVF